MEKTKVSLKSLNTFGIDCHADRIIEIASHSEACKLASDRLLKNVRYFILGGGSNVLFTSDFNGTIIHPAIKGIGITGSSDSFITISAGAGEEWDNVVKWSICEGFGGLENLSLIPGQTGAVPVQNIGAYGAEASEFVTNVTTVDLTSGETRVFDAAECGFGYRKSVFKHELKGRYLITSVSFRLPIKWKPRIGYGALRELEEMGPDINPALVRDKVIAIRRSKLPDPKITGNAGSYFKNPVVGFETAARLREDYTDIISYPESDGNIKIAAGWLVEKCGLKGFRLGNAGVHGRQALVLVNLGGATGKEIEKLGKTVQKAVFEKFGVLLEREVEIV
jgi:UDP-N-acetylmuramate dehydrogenase